MKEVTINIMDQKLTFTIEIDDLKLVKEVESQAKQQIVDGIKQKVLTDIFQTPIYRGKPDSEVDPLNDDLNKIIADTVLQYKDDIIDKAADKLATNLARRYDVRSLLGAASEQVD